MITAIGSRSVLACKDTLAAAFVERLAGMQLTPTPDALESNGVSAMVWQSHAKMAHGLDGVALDDLHCEVLSTAWRDGAWDVRLMTPPPRTGIELMSVASLQFEDSLLKEQLIDAAQNGTLAWWTWLPLHNGPLLRRRAHQAKDCTLRADGGRDGPIPESKCEIKWRWRTHADRTIRLGDWSDQHRPKPTHGPDARAPHRVRGYIVDLRRRLGRSGEPLPAALTRSQASAIIDDLLGEAKK